MTDFPVTDKYHQTITRGTKVKVWSKPGHPIGTVISAWHAIDGHDYALVEVPGTLRNGQASVRQWRYATKNLVMV